MDGILLPPLKFMTYCSQISRAVREKRGDRLAELLIVEGELVDQVVAGLFGSSVRPFCPSLGRSLGLARRVEIRRAYIDAQRG